MISKKIKVLVLAGMVMFTGFAGTVMADVKTEDNGSVPGGIIQEGEMPTCEINFGDMKFEDYFNGIEKDLSKEELKKAKALFEEAKELEKAEKYEESQKKWDEIYKIIDKIYEKFEEAYFEDMKDMKFEDFFYGLKEVMSKEDYKKAEALFDKVKLMDDKKEETGKAWDELYKIVDKYMDKIEGSMGITEPGFSIEDMKFEDFFNGIEKDLSKEELKKAKDLFEEAKELEIAEKFEEAQKKWDEIYNILDKHFEKFEESSFVNNIKDMKFDEYFYGYKEVMSKEDYKKAEALFNKVKVMDDKKEETGKVWDELYKIIDKYMDKIVEPTTCVMPIEEMKFEDFFYGLDKVATKEDLTKAKSLFEEIQKLEKAEKFEESSKVWEKLDKILEKYKDKLEAEFKAEDMKFEDLVWGLEKEINKEDMSKLKAIFEKLVKLEKSEKYEEAEKQWNEFYNILDKYMERFYNEVEAK